MKGLEGKTILITRAVRQAKNLASLIQRRGGNPLVFPMIEIHPPDSWDRSDQALRSLETYNGLLFTSVNGVEYFFSRINELHVNTNGLPSKHTYVVGPKTRAAAERHGLSVTAFPQQFTAVELAQLLTKETVEGRKFLFPRGDKGKDVLADDLRLKGATVDAVTVYQTKYVDRQDLERMHRQIMNGNIDVITFTSPSAVMNFASMFSTKDRTQLRQLCKIAVIGPVTNDSLSSVNMHADIVAHESTVEALVDAIEGFFAN